jgi:cbb3-type cytochrome oxidase maturation protein
MRCGRSAHDSEKWERDFGYDQAQTDKPRRPAVNVLVYLIPMALGLGLIGLFAFLWALRSGQYSDVEGAALRVLSDDDVERPAK